MGFIEFRKKILFALHAAKIRARAACIRGSRSALGPRTPSDRLMSRDPIRQRRFPPAETLEEFMPALVRKDCAGSVLGLQREATWTGKIETLKHLSLVVLTRCCWFVLPLILPITQSSEDGPELMPFSTKFVS